jgi:hypothetical protein
LQTIIERQDTRECALFKTLLSFLQELETKLDKPPRLPVIFGRMIDGILQQLLDLILRDYVGVWCSDAGFKSDELIQDLK